MTDVPDTETIDAVVRGSITLAEIEGMTAAEAYSIADFGWMQLEQGQLRTAVLLFEMLTLSNPRHAYFHALHGVALQRCGATEHAMAAYASALDADPNETAALVNRAEQHQLNQVQ